MKPKIIISDLDGTIALDAHRKHYLESNNWDAYFEACDKDVPNVAVIKILELFHEQNEALAWIFTGRSRSVETKTTDWLEKHKVPWYEVFMRPVGDHTPDVELKEEWYRKWIKDHFDVLFVLEDRTRVVDMWRSLGIPCFQVAPGDF